MLAALRQRSDVVFFLTDAEDPPLNPAQLRRIVARNGGRTTIHCVRFGAGPTDDPDGFMQQLARLNRGSYRYVDVLRWKRR